MSLPDPYELKRSGQPVPAEHLMRWAEEAGFEVRNGGRGSHVQCRHKKFRDIHFGIVAKDVGKSSHKHFALALIEVQKRQAELSTPVNDFNSIAALKFEDLQKKLPAHIEADHDFKTGETVLRDKQIPQLGLTMKTGEERLLENNIRYLESLKRDAYILLNRARSAYDIDIGPSKHHAFSGTLEHTIYDMPKITLPAYQQNGDPAKFFNTVQGYIDGVIIRDMENEERLGSILKQSFVKAAFVVFTARRGERSNVIVMEKPDGSDFKIRFETASNRRADRHDVYGGRIAAWELNRVERTIGGIALGHVQKGTAEYAPALRLQA